MLGLRRSFSKRSWLPFRARQISALVVAEFKDSILSGATLNTVGAATELGGEVTVLVAGSSVKPVSDRLRRVEGVCKVLVADDACLAHHLAERLAPLVAAIQRQRSFTHVLAPSTSFGRNFLPRAAAILDSQPISDVVRIIDTHTYVRPIYAGNALQTVQTSPKGVQLMTVRSTAFPAASEAGDSAPVESISAKELAAAQDVDARVSFVSEELQRSERPELGAARVVVSDLPQLRPYDSWHPSPDLPRSPRAPVTRAPAWGPSTIRARPTITQQQHGAAGGTAVGVPASLGRPFLSLPTPGSVQYGAAA